MKIWDNLKALARAKYEKIILKHDWSGKFGKMKGQIKKGWQQGYAGTEQGPGKSHITLYPGDEFKKPHEQHPLNIRAIS